MQSEKEALIEEYTAAAFKHKDAQLPMYVWRQHFVEFADKLAALSAAEPQPAPSVAVTPAKAKCKNCGGNLNSWFTSNRVNSVAVDGRLKSSEISCDFVLGCDECSETLQVVPADEIASQMNAALSAQVQDESEIVDCLLSGKPFVFDPATNFCHADDGGAPEHGIKYVPGAQVQEEAGCQLVPKEPTPEMVKRGARVSAIASHSAVRKIYSAMLAAAPAKQEGGTNE